MLNFGIGFLIGSLVCSLVENAWEIVKIRKYMQEQKAKIVQNKSSQF